jgi:hypothetical protein
VIRAERGEVLHAPQGYFSAQLWECWLPLGLHGWPVGGSAGGFGHQHGSAWLTYRFSEDLKRRSSIQ